MRLLFSAVSSAFRYGFSRYHDYFEAATLMMALDAMLSLFSPLMPFSLILCYL